MATVIGFSGRKREFHHSSYSYRETDGSEKLGALLSLGVIPRMLLSQPRPVEEPDDDEPVVRPEDVERIAPLAVNEAAHVVLDRVEAIMRRGVSVEDIFVDLLAPVARWLGTEWEEDRLDFLQVSMALWRLQEVLRQVAANTTRVMDGDVPRSALFASMPGDQHSFGASMIHECFTIAGWDAELLLEGTRQQLVDTVAKRRFDLVGLTLTCDCHGDHLGSLVRAVRSVSANPDVRIMLGGRVAAEQPHLVALAGADGTALTAPEAVKAAERMVGMTRMAATA